MESMRDTKRIMEREIKKGSTPLQFERIELDAGCYQEIASKEKLTEVLQYLHRVGEYKALASKTIINNVYTCVLSIENPQNRKENSPLSDREIPIIRKKHVESFRFFPYLVGKKAAFTAFCPIG